MKLSKMIILAIACGFIFAGSLEAEVLWQDNFDGYAADTHISNTTAWSTNWWESYRFVEVGRSDGRAYFYNAYWGDWPIRIAVADGVNSHHIGGVAQSDYTVKAECTDFGGYELNWHILGRVSGIDTTGENIRLGAIRNGSELTARIQDSGGYFSGDVSMGTFVSGEPVYLELTMEGYSVIGKVTHNGVTQTISYTTTVINSGNPGFGGYDNGYAVGYFDNFEVLSSASSYAGPEKCGDHETVYKNADLNRDCYVNLFDVAELTNNWLECTDPNSNNCQ